MKIFFFSTVFAPSVGGIERLVEMLCDAFTQKGHAVELATLTCGDDDDRRFPYRVHRRPSLRRFRELLRWCDVHVQANVSLRHAWPRLVAPHRFVYQHNNVYQRDDGSLSGPDRLKRLLARHTPGIANSRYTAAKLGCTHTIMNAFDDGLYHSDVAWHERPGDLVFLGRLVSQKGCDTLVRALARLRSQGWKPALTIIGDGPDRKWLGDLSRRLDVDDQIRFTGVLKGEALAAELNRHRIFIAPSRYEEPFGIVALEALACGCVPVVSARGGLVDAVGPHGLTFSNGDDADLAARLHDLLVNPDVSQTYLDGVESHLADFRIETVAERYLRVFAEETAR